jgi:hypothetical protein
MSKITTVRSQTVIVAQLTAMGCTTFEVGVLRSDGRMILRERWREAEIIDALAWLRHENAAGAQIYVRPAGVHALTLIDDLTAETVQSMAGEGFEPAVVVETSRGNYQVWLKHAEVLDERTSTAAAKLLAARLAGDPSSADWRHFGRLAGFTNQKLQRRLPSGLAPFVRLRESSGEIFSRAQETAREVRRTLAEASRAPGLTPGQHSDGASGLRPIAEFHRDPVYGGDLHRADLGWATQAAGAGLSLEQIRDAILTARDLRHKGDAKRQLDYATRTAQKALAPE